MLTHAQWLARYEHWVHNTRGRHISLSHYRMQMRHLWILFKYIIQSDGTNTHIPTKRGNICVGDHKSYEGITALQQRVVSGTLSDGNNGPGEYRRKGLTPTEVRKLFSIVRTTQERLLLYIFVTTGLRIAAVAALKILDVTKARLQTTEKGGLQRVITLSDCGGRLLLKSVEEGASNNYVFPGRLAGTHLSCTQIWRKCRILFQRAGLHRQPQAHPHAFRHTVVHMLFYNSVPLVRIARWLGHSDVGVTSSVYCELAPENVHDLYGSNQSIHSHGQQWRALAAFLVDPFAEPIASANPVSFMLDTLCTCDLITLQQQIMQQLTSRMNSVSDNQSNSTANALAAIKTGVCPHIWQKNP